jgi:hypothetical protein
MHGISNFLVPCVGPVCCTRLLMCRNKSRSAVSTWQASATINTPLKIKAPNKARVLTSLNFKHGTNGGKYSMTVERDF